MQEAGREALSSDPDVEPLHLECEHFLQCIVTGERPRTDANNAYHVVRVLADVEKRLSARPRLKAIETISN